MKSILIPRAAILAALTALGTQAQAQLFSDNFDSNTSSSWTVNASATGNHPATFAFDYSTVGIPSAPRSTGGSTSGLKLQANLPGGAAFFGGVSVSPNGQSFTGSYVLSFDMWMNFNGPFPGGGNGSTQAGGAGIGTAGTSVQMAGAADSIHFSTTGDGGATVDYRAYSPNTTSGYGDASGVFAAGTTGSPRNGSNVYYSSLGGVAAPSEQVDLFAQQTGTTGTGSFGMKWHQVDIRYENSIATYSIDGLLIATVDATTAGTLGGNNILLNYYDTNSGQSTDPNAGALLFGLFDNVTVTAVPEPEEYAAVAASALIGFALWRRSRRA